MKPFLAAMALVPLAACVTPQEDAAPTGMPNPASVYCESVGGKSVVKTAPDGSEAGYCQLPDGKVVDEWELYRSRSKA